MSGSISAALMIWKICGPIINLRIGFSGVVSSAIADYQLRNLGIRIRTLFPILTTHIFKTWSLNQPRTSFRMLHVRRTFPYTELVLVLDVSHVSPLTPANGSLITKRSFQKKVLSALPSGRKRIVADSPSLIFQNG